MPGDCGAFPDFPTLLREILQGRSNGKIVWQPRVCCYLSDRQFRGEPYPAPYAGMSEMEIFRAMRMSNRLYDFNACVNYEYHHSGVHVHWRDLDDLHLEYRIETPKGTLTQLYRRNTANYGSYTVKWLVETEEEMKLLIWLEEQSSFSFSQEKFDELLAQQGDLGLPCMYLQRTNLLRLFYEHCGVENTIFALADFPDTVEAYFDVLNRKQEALCHLAGQSPFEWINFGDNVHCGMLPPNLFKKYVLPEYCRRNEILHGYGKFTHAHWDGDVKALLPYAKETMLDGIEAITPIPQGDVTLEEMKEHLGDMFLIDGIPAVYFDAEFPVETLIAHTKRCIELFAPRLILGISDEMSSRGEMDRLLVVRDVVENYNARMG